MRITKDEALVLSYALEELKYNLALEDHEKKIFSAVEELQYKLEQHGVDGRRVGRRSSNSYSDVMKRFSTTLTK